MVQLYGNQGKSFLEELVRQGNNSPVCIDKEVLTITTGSLGLANIPVDATHAEIQVESTNTSDAVRYWYNGSAPTASVGMKQGDGAYIEITNAENIRKFRIIKGTGGGTTQINVLYFK
jgi:hypothetical protein